MLQVVTGVRWIKGLIRSCACLTEARVRGRHLDMSAMLGNGRNSAKRDCVEVRNEYLHSSGIASRSKVFFMHRGKLDREG